MHDVLESQACAQSLVDAADDAGEATFTIGAVAREFGVTFRTLRFYESRGLVAPLRTGQARRYRPADRERLALILRGKKLGFTLGEIARMIGGDAAGATDALDLNRQRCAEQINLLELKKRQIETALAELRLVYASQDTRPRWREPRIT
jgi:DNA-binding transcriptional MerR regulator